MLPGKSNVPKLDPTRAPPPQLKTLPNDQTNSSESNHSQDGNPEQNPLHTPSGVGQTQPKMLDTKSYLERMRHYHELGLVDQQGKPKSDRFTPLDLSGHKRKVESPLDLTIKTTRRCADTTQDLEQIMNSDLKSRPLLNGHCDSSQVPRNPRKEKLLAYKQQCGVQHALNQTPIQSVVQAVESKTEVPVKLLDAYHTSSRRYLLLADGLRTESLSRGGLTGSVAMQAGNLAVERAYDAHDGGIKIIAKPVPRDLIQNNNSAFGTYNLMTKEQTMKKTTKLTITRASSPENQEQITSFQPIKPAAPLRVNTNIPVKPVVTLSPNNGSLVNDGRYGVNVDNVNSGRMTDLIPSPNNTDSKKINIPVPMDMTARSEANAKRTNVHSESNSDSGKNSRSSSRMESREVKTGDKSAGDSNSRSMKSSEVPTKKLSVSVKQISTDGIRKAIRTPPKSPKSSDKNGRKSRNSSPEKRLGRKTPEKRESPEKKPRRTPDKSTERLVDKFDGKDKLSRSESDKRPKNARARQKSPIKRTQAERKKTEAEMKETRTETSLENGVKSDDAVSSSDERTERSSGRNTPSSRGKKRTLLEKLNDGNGFIVDQKRRKASSSLDVDPATLGREERLLRHALLRFDTLDAKSSSPDPTQDEKKRKRDKSSEVEASETPAKNKVPNNKSSTNNSPKHRTPVKKTRLNVELDESASSSQKSKNVKKTTNKTKANARPADNADSDAEITDKEQEERPVEKVKRTRKERNIVEEKTDSDIETRGDAEDDTKQEPECDEVQVRAEDSRIDEEDKTDDTDDQNDHDLPDLRPRDKEMKKNNRRIQKAKSD